jgi:crotonobetaine/carnitine-CoA ligase
MLPYSINNILTDHSFYYMDPQWQLVMALHCGARLNVAGRLSASKFIDRIKRYDIDMAWIPRPLLSQKASPDDVNLPLKKLFIGGASAENIVQLQQRFGINVSNAYGMTEIGPGLIVPDEITDVDVLGTCGLMTPFRQCKVMLENGEEAARDEPGELWIKGDGIFKGYYNKPKANAESFVGNWFRTGDKFIQTEKGYFKIIGRFKDMIRRSSENISAMEVEYVLSQHPQIEQAAVVAVPDDYRGEEVKAYVLVRAGENNLTAEQVIDHCQTKLAAFKIPRYLEFVRDFPYTPTKKVAKHKLISTCKDLTENSWDRNVQAKRT